MNLIIDIEKSLKTKRLIYNGSSRQLLWIYFSSYAGCIGTVAFFLIVLSQTFYKNYPIQVSIFLILLTSFVILNAYFINKLYVVEIADKNFSLLLLTQELNNYYNNVQTSNVNSNILIAKTTASFWAFDRTFIVLADKDNIAMNLSVFGRGQMKYCLIAIANYYKCKKILNNLKENKTTANKSIAASGADTAQHEQQ